MLRLRDSKVKSIHPGHRTQEEDVFSSWMLAEAGDRPENWNRLFVSTIAHRYGLTRIDSRSTETKQGVDYTEARDPLAFADAWIVRNAWVLGKSDPKHFDRRLRAPCDLIFAAGPNAGLVRTPTGSTARTFCKFAAENYIFSRSVSRCASGRR